MNEKQMWTAGIVLVALLVIGGVYALMTVRVVGAGEVGVHDVFGEVKGTFQPGLVIKHPLGSITTYSTKTNTIKEVASVPSSEGLAVDLEASIIYRIDGNKASYIYREIENIDQIIKTNFRSTLRDVSASFQAKALYTESREEVSIAIRDKLKDSLVNSGVLIEDVKLRNVRLPNKVANAIEAKLQAEQEAQQMEFVLQREELEAERKVVEAEGIAQSQDIIQQKLTPLYIQYLAIQAYKELANSPNTTYIMMPTSPEGAGMPVILGS